MINDTTGNLEDLMGYPIRSSKQEKLCQKDSCNKKLNIYQAAISKYCCSCAKTVGIWKKVDGYKATHNCHNYKKRG